MPGQAPSPRAASLAEAPRILNEPVRCRFSALRTTRDPVSSVSTRQLYTGVCTAMRSTARRAASIWSSPISSGGEAGTVIGSSSQRPH